MTDMRREPAEQLYLLTDAEGEEVPCQLLDRLEVRGQTYVIMAPLEEEDTVMVFRVEVDGDGTESFTPEDEEAVEAVFELFQDECADLYNFTCGEEP